MSEISIFVKITVWVRVLLKVTKIQKDEKNEKIIVTKRKSCDIINKDIYVTSKGERKMAEERAVVGRNAVLELLRSDNTVDKIFLQRGLKEGSISLIVAEAKRRGVPVAEVDKRKLDALSGGVVHQGVAAYASEVNYYSVDELLEIAEKRGEKPFLIICDGINDPHNLGAIIRSADVAGVHGVIIPKRGSVGVTMTVVRSAAGATEYVAVAKVSNIASTIDYLKDKGVWIYALEADGTDFYEEDLSGACALVLGSEGDGVSRLVREKSDYCLSIPMYGKVNSLNVSNAAAVVMMEAARQKHKK